MKHTHFKLLTAILLGLGICSCQTASPGASGDRPDGQAAPGSDQARPGTDAPPTLLETDPGEVRLGLEAIREATFTSGMTLGLEKPKEPPSSRYGDGMTLFSYDVRSLGGRKGRELVMVIMNVKSGDEILVPSRRAQVAFMTDDSEHPHFSAESGFVRIEKASDERLVGRFEVRFDELDSTIVHGTFDTQVDENDAPAAAGTKQVGW